MELNNPGMWKKSKSEKVAKVQGFEEWFIFVYIVN